MFTFQRVGRGFLAADTTVVHEQYYVVQQLHQTDLREHLSSAAVLGQPTSITVSQQTVRREEKKKKITAVGADTVFFNPNLLPRQNLSTSMPQNETQLQTFKQIRVLKLLLI